MALRATVAAPGADNAQKIGRTRLFGLAIFGPAQAAMAAGKLPRDRGDAAVTVAVAKQKGTNAVHVARQLEEKLDELKRDVIPDGVEVPIRRNYGETANDKVNELVGELTTAIINLDRVRKVCVLCLGSDPNGTTGYGVRS